MLNYTGEQIKEILVDILENKDFNIIPVGNHHLKRHLVYEVHMNSGEKFIFKLYYINRRRSREIASLKLLENSDIKCPKIFRCGNLKDGSEWLITEHIRGEILDKVMPDMTQDNKIRIFEEMGRELGKLHSFKIFDFFGEWNEKGESIHNIRSYYNYYVKSVEKEIEVILTKNLPDKNILFKAIEIIRENYKLLDANVVPRLVHNDYDGRNILVERINEQYSLSGIIDFEGTYPGNAEQDFISLYYRYFLNNKDLEASFFKGYNEYMEVDSDFKKRLNIYLLGFVIGNCSWSYIQAPDYYKNNIDFLKELIKI